jgi:hypothetical protein
MHANGTKSSDNSSITARVLAGAVGSAFAFQTILILVEQIRGGFNAIGIVLASALALVTLICWWGAVNGISVKTRSRLHYGLKGGLIMGSLAFAGGFVGPMILMPESNQGPLVGIFFTGPVGFVIGYLSGIVYGWNRISANDGQVAID